MQVFMLLLDERFEQAMHEALMEYKRCRSSQLVMLWRSQLYALVKTAVLAQCGLSWLIAHQECNLQCPLGRTVDVFGFRSVGHFIADGWSRREERERKLGEVRREVSYMGIMKAFQHVSE